MSLYYNIRISAFSTADQLEVANGFARFQLCWKLKRTVKRLKLYIARTGLGLKH